MFTEMMIAHHGSNKILLIKKMDLKLTKSFEAYSSEETN
ncbi:hypothetical protein B4065_3451 [Caldibacillus thermoamylovorans]|nr:hypothetical protein B4065_3451 [Caldibacillus thermoamylovorans]